MTVDLLTHYIRIYDMVVPDDFLQNLIKEAHFIDGHINHYKINKERRLCKASSIITPYYCDIIWNNIHNALEEYLKITPYLHISKNKDGYTLLKYEKNGLFKEHVDFIDVTNNEKNIRQLAVVILLNDEFEGGCLQFFNGTYTVPLKKNQLVIYPANFMYPHQVTPIVSGIRYTIVTWLL